METSWQEKENERYLETLRERWSPEGERLPMPTYDAMARHQASYSAVLRGIPIVYGDPEHGINSVGECKQ